MFLILLNTPNFAAYCPKNKALLKNKEFLVVKFTKIVNIGQDWSLKIVLNFNTVAPHQQIPLIYVVNEDDELLANSPDAEWYKILQNLPWEQYRSIGADYYNALYHFNKSSADNQIDKNPFNPGSGLEKEKQVISNSCRISF